MGVNRVGGTVIAGHKVAWITWRQIYYDVMGRMIAAGRFVGKDQNVMANVAVLHPDIIDLVRPQPYFDGTGNEWFYLQYHLS